MAVNKKKVKALLDEIDGIFDVLPTQMSPRQKEYFKKIFMGPAIKEIEDRIVNSRPPKMMMVGRSGHGKSSTINAIAGKEVTTVSDVKPGQVESIPLYIEFPEFHSTWEFIDTRGYFDPVKPDGARIENAEEQLINDILRYKPDVFMHVINIKEIRTLSNDIETFKRIRSRIKKKNLNIPAMIVLSHCDILGKRKEWPLLEHPNKAAQVMEAMRYLSEDILQIKRVEYLEKDSPIKGFSIDDGTYLGIIPICSLEDDLWNIDTLRRTIGYNLPNDANFDFFQATRDKEMLRHLSTSIIKRYSVIAGGIGSMPLPIADIIILTPLQLLLIAIVALLSGREISKDHFDPVYEFMAAAGVNIGAAFGFRTLAHQMVKLIPVAGIPISGGIASSVTYGIGKSAERYFFMNEIVKPKKLMKNID